MAPLQQYGNPFAPFAKALNLIMILFSFLTGYIYIFHVHLAIDLDIALFLAYFIVPMANILLYVDESLFAPLVGFMHKWATANIILGFGSGLLSGVILLLDLSLGSEILAQIGSIFVLYFLAYGLVGGIYCLTLLQVLPSQDEPTPPAELSKQAYYVRV